MDEHNRRFFYNFEKNIAKYESADEPQVAPASPEAAQVAPGSVPHTPQPPSATKTTPDSRQRTGWATPGRGGAALEDPEAEENSDDDGLGFVNDSLGMMNRMMMTSDIGAALGAIFHCFSTDSRLFSG